MFDKLFSPETIEETLRILQTEIPLACWETVYVTVLATAFAVILGLPLGVLLVVGEKDGVRPLPKGVMHVLNVIINLLRSVPFLILMIMVFPLTRLIVGTAVGTVASIVSLVIAAFPFHFDWYRTNTTGISHCQTLVQAQTLARCVTKKRRQRISAVSS